MALPGLSSIAGRMKILLLLAFALSCSISSAEIVRLKNVDTGEISGPYKQGQVISIGTNRYVVMIGTSDVSVSRQLETIMLPEVNFRQTDLRDVVTFLQDASITYDPQGLGVNFLLMPLKAPTGKGGSTVTSTTYPKVTMNIKEVPLKDVLSLIHSATGFGMRIQHNAVVIRPPTPVKR